MRIILHGHNAFGCSVLKALLDQGEQVVGVYSAPDRVNEPIDALKLAAMDAGLPVFQPNSWRTPESLTQFQSLKADICLMAEVTRYMPEEILNVPTYGSVQYHPSLLPKHRGPSAIQWAIIEGETETGVSIFWPDNGLDSGAVLLQKKVTIAPADTQDSLRKKLSAVGVAAILEALLLIKQNNAPRMAQDDRQATYQSWCRREQARIDWVQPLQQIYNLVRGCNPGPGAWCMYQSEALSIFDCTPVQGAALPGQVVNISKEGITVATTGGALLLQSVADAQNTKHAALAWAKQSGLKIGDQFE